MGNKARQREREGDGERKIWGERGRNTAVRENGVG